MSKAAMSEDAFYSVPGDYDLSRRVEHPIYWAKLSETGPPHVEKAKRRGKRKGSSARGNTYERKVARVLRNRINAGHLEGTLYDQQWIAFADAKGRTFAQPDQFVVQQDSEHGANDGVIWLFECKRTQNSKAQVQLLELYRPLLEYIFDRPVYCVQVFKHMRALKGAYVSRLVDDLDEALALKLPLTTWHFIDL